MKRNYYHIKYYPIKLDKLKRDKKNFQITSTGYTKKIITEDRVMFFNDDGSDNKKVLLLISTVRRDAKKFLETKTVDDVPQETDFFNLLDIIDEKEVIVKVDLKSAYWEYALKAGIITEKTNQKFIEWFSGVDAFYAKQARLKALGSLATSKFTSIYKNGKFTYGEPVETQPTKAIYMEVCNGVDRLMKDCNFHVDGCVYYYWDCMFVKKEFEQQAVDYLKSRGYDTSTAETKLDYVKIGDTGYLLSTSDNKIYMTKKENKFLLGFEDDDY